MFSNYIRKIDVIKRLEQCQIFDDINFRSANSDSLAILLTPICDIVRDDVDHFIFCALLPYEHFYFNHLRTTSELQDIDITDPRLSKGKRNKAVEHIKNIVGNRFERFHWIGAIPKQEGFWYVDYQLIQTVSLSDSESLRKKRLFELLPPLNQSVSVRFSNYLGRIGLPVENEDRDAHTNEIFEYLKTKKQQE